MTLLARLRRWRRYHRELSRLIDARLDAGYSVPAAAEWQFREQARAAAGYEVTRASGPESHLLPVARETRTRKEAP